MRAPFAAVRTRTAGASAEKWSRFFAILRSAEPGSRSGPACCCYFSKCTLIERLWSKGVAEETATANAANTVEELRAFLRRTARFGVSGIVSTLLYFVIAWMLTSATALPVAIASFLAFCSAGVISYLLHRGYTFENRDRSSRSKVRFIVVNVLANAVAVVAPWIACDIAGYRPIVGIALVCVLVPALNFVLLSLYVFRPAAGSD